MRYMGVRGDFTVNKEIPPGRGFLVKAVQASMVQICLPIVEGLDGKSPDEQLSDLIGGIRKKYRKPAEWSYRAQDLGPLEAALGVEITVSAAAPIQSETLSELSDIMAMQASLAEQMEGGVEEASEFARVEVKSTGKSKKKKKAAAKPKSKAAAKSKPKAAKKKKS